MCLRISDDKKAQPAKGFPKGWSFFFQSLDTNNSSSSTLADLYILNPSGTKFRSVSAACARHKLQLDGLVNLKRDFHLHIGEDSPVSSASSNQKHGKRKQSPGSAKRKRKKAKRVLSSTREIGSRVYSNFENGVYYWGEIVSKEWKERKNKKGKRFHFAIRYDDGDYQSDISDDTADRRIDLKLFTEEQMRQLNGRCPPPRPDHLDEATDLSPPPKQKNTGYTPAELYQFRCAKCSFCAKKPCTRCVSCRNNASRTTEQTECCLQKVTLCRILQIFS
jgi:hypothetical protein